MTNLDTLYNETLIGMANGKTSEAAFDELIGKGVPETNARMMVDQAARVKSAAFRQAGLKAAGRGAVFVAIGVAITAGTYSLGGSTFLVAWGPVIFGGWQMLKGLYQAATA